MLIFSAVNGVSKPNLAHPLFYKKFYWHTAMSVGLYIVYGCIQPQTAALNNYNRDLVAHTLENSYYLVIYRKSLPTPCLDQSGPTTWISAHFHPGYPGTLT